MSLKERIDSVFAQIRKQTDANPAIGMILGSGLGDYAEKLENPTFIDYDSLDGLPVSTVEGHAGRFVVGERFGKTIIAMQGRFHFYEGYSQAELTIPVRIMKKLGCETVIITNACGGVNTSFDPGTLMLITDQINYSGSHPLIGTNLDEYGTRFPDISDIYTKALRSKVKESAKKHNIKLAEGVYMMFSGPSYETPAEVKMSRIVGADAVGMSTVPEGIVAAHCGMKVIGISCITNHAAGVKDESLSHSDVVKIADATKPKFTSLIDVIIEEVL